MLARVPTNRVQVPGAGCLRRVGRDIRDYVIRNGALCTTQLEVFVGDRVSALCSGPLCG